MSSMFYERRHLLGASQCDFNGSCKLSSLLETIQDTANEHSRTANAGRDELAVKGLAWVLFKIDLQIDRYPRVGEEILIQTFTKGVQFRFIPRYSIVRDGEGAVICRAGSLWMLMDKTTHKTISPQDSGVVLPNAEKKELPIKISMARKKVDGEAQTGVWSPLYSEIDINGHVNNTRYADWLCNNMGLAAMRAYEVGFISIDYSYEIPPETMIEHSLIVKDNEFLFSGSSEGDHLFSIYGKLRPRIRSHEGER